MGAILQRWAIAIIIAPRLPPFCVVYMSDTDDDYEYQDVGSRRRLTEDQIREKVLEPHIVGTWVQTQRAAHEAFAALISKSPRAALLMHTLIANMDTNNALIASHATLKALSGQSVSTLKRAISELVEGQWIQTISIGGQRSGAVIYVVNSRVAWANKRSRINYAYLNARVLISSEDQAVLDGPDLRQLPRVKPGEKQLPHGDGETPPSQPSIEGFEPDLPALRDDSE